MTKAGVVTTIGRGLAAAAVAVGVGVLPVTSAAEAPAKAEPADLAALSVGLTADQAAELRFLEHLGWTFERDAAAKAVTVHEGTPCYRRDAEALKGGGDLRVVVPGALEEKGAAAFATTVAGLADSVATRCAFKQKVAVATREATRKLSAIAEEGEYTFPKLLVVDSLWFRCTLPEPEWKKDGVENLCTGSPSKAIEAVYEKGGVAECYSAQWVAIFAIQYELYGAAWFDQVFKNEELRIGRPQEAYQTAIGRYVDESKPYAWRSLLIPEAQSREDPVLVLARHGPKAFAGLTGVLQNDQEEIGANQNFTIVSVTPRAVEELRARGGLARIVELTTAAVDVRKQARTLSASEWKENKARREAIYADPVLSEFQIYVHPYGVVPLGKMVEREIGDHGRPIKIRIYTNGLDDFLYQRYRSAWKERWLREHGSALPPSPPLPPEAPPPEPPGEPVPTRPPATPPATEPPSTGPPR